MSDRWDEIAKETWGKLLGFGLANLGRKTATDIIAQALRKAVADERERCAKIAEAESGPGFSCRHVDHAQGFCECSAKAAAIRAPHGRGRR